MRPERLETEQQTTRFLPTEDGVKVNGSVLWLDSLQNGELSFLSNAIDYRSSTVPRIISTEETLRMIEARKKNRPNALVCQYNRPFSIGNIRLELLPSGGVLGSASLLLEHNNEKILYAPHVNPARSLTNRQMQLKRAHTLILGAFQSSESAISASPPPKKERERFLATVASSVEADNYPTILLRDLGVGSELTRLLTDAGYPVGVSDPIFRINKVYESFGSKLGEYSRLTVRNAKNRITILPASGSGCAIRARVMGQNKHIFLIEDGGDHQRGIPTLRAPDDIFYIYSPCDQKDIREIISTVGAKEVYFIGPYAKKFADEFQGVCKVVKPLYSNYQPTLF